jgi:hypothetical protein
MNTRGGSIYQGLLERGLPEHIAQAFMDSYMAESGLDPTINEIAPLVPGSRGGRGLYQLTGSRRKAFEDKYGEDGYTIDNQLDWMMHELAGPEARAAKSIFAAPDRASAVKAITRDFLRPAKDNSAARIGMWNPSSAMAGLDMGTTPAPKAGIADEPKPLGKGQAAIARLVGLDDSPDKFRKGGRALHQLGLQMMQNSMGV